MRKARGEVRAMILAALHRPQGVKASELACGRTTAAKNFAALRDEGLAFAAGHHWDLRYFDTPERAAKYVPEPINPSGGAVRQRREIPRFRPRPLPKPVREGWGPDDPVHITSETKVTICPTPPRALKSNTYLQFA